MSKAKIAVFNGPNLNLLGSREPEVYGTTTLEDINTMLVAKANKADVNIECRQSNCESEIIDWIHQSADVDFIIINPAAFTHTSVAIRDAFAGIGVPFIEIHLSNVHARESFRHHSYFSDIAVGVIVGLGYKGYLYALDAALNHIKT